MILLSVIILSRVKTNKILLINSYNSHSRDVLKLNANTLDVMFMFH